MYSELCIPLLGLECIPNSEYYVFCWLGGAEEGHAPTGRAMASAAWETLHPQIHQIKDKLNIIHHKLFWKVWDFQKLTTSGSTKIDASEESSQHCAEMGSDGSRSDEVESLKTRRNPSRFVSRLGELPFSCLPRRKRQRRPSRWQLGGRWRLGDGNLEVATRENFSGEIFWNPS